MSNDLKMHVSKVRPIIKRGKFKGTYLDSDIRFINDGTQKRWLNSGEIASVNAFFFKMCDKLSNGEIIDLSMDITRKVYGMYPNIDAIRAMIKMYGIDTEIDIEKVNSK